MKIYNKIIRTCCLLFAIFSISSCEKYFELERPIQFPWQNATELELAVREGYLHLSNDPWFNPMGSLSMIDFGQSDIARLLPEAIQGNNYATQYYNRTYATAPSDKEVAETFKFLYYIITNNNAALQMLNDAERDGKDPFEGMVNADRERVKRYKGELYFMRAVAYWYLARIYAPPFNPNGSNESRHFVLRTDYVRTAEELKNPKLGSVAEVWAQIQSDLEKAKDLLPESYVTTETQPKGRANKFAASGMLSRVYFITGQHAKAKAECDFILASSLYNLSEDPITAFNRTGAQDAKEVIWETAYVSPSTRFDRTPGIYGKNLYNNNNRGGDYSTYTLSYSALKEVGWMADGLKGNFAEVPDAKKDKRYTQLYKRYEQYGVPGGDPNATCKVARPEVWIDKYFRSSNGRYSNRPMIRLAEVYLTRSILRFTSGDVQGAAQDLNVVRKRAGLEDITAAKITANDIHNERIKEMASEHGDRNYYLIGLRLPLGIGDRDPARFSPVNPPYSNYYWPVPLVEQQQNASYQ
ncbi:RagB/SusD family nutrient uptake outer membrane protein [Larkinella bovis]|uniref:RagB/SusD family nutrient uptake outer membrane protein n=1 Tax=Larkinella bovis TaxID=683041 RepID=A0ABW0IF79_9BACT